MNLRLQRFPQAAVLFLMTMASAWAQPQTATVDTINKTVNAAVSNAADQSYTICELDAALWGNYTVQVGVPAASTIGKQALLFQVAGGILTQAVNPTPSTLSFATSSATGTLLLPDRDAAFAMGVPLWIGNVSFTGPNLNGVQYTLYSNPSLFLAGAVPPSPLFDLFETIVPRSLNPQGVGLDNNVTYNHFGPSIQPQTFMGGMCDPLNSTSCSSPFNHGYENYLWAGSGSPPRICPVSNQVDLQAASVSTCLLYTSDAADE